MKAEKRLKCAHSGCKTGVIEQNQYFYIDHHGNTFHTSCYTIAQPDLGAVITVEKDTRCGHAGCIICADGDPSKRGIIKKGNRAFIFIKDGEGSICYHQQCFTKKLTVEHRFSGRSGGAGSRAGHLNHVLPKLGPYAT